MKPDLPLSSSAAQPPLGPLDLSGSLRSSPALRYGWRALVAVTWASMGIFGVYIAVYYGGAIPAGEPRDWNAVLPRLYVPGERWGSVAIGAHFLAGSMLLAMGPAQLITGPRGTTPRLHRWMGRVYVAAAAIAGLGGTLYIALRGTVGGTPMNVGFGLYGVLMVVAAVETFMHARARQLAQHRAWAIRLVALAVGSWLYRMDYGLWLKLAHGIGHHSRTFDGPFDAFMAFFFYVPNLAVAEALIRAGNTPPSGRMRRVLTPLVIVAAALIALATWLFTASYWAPHIVARIAAL
ncbi:DUF2306 domain-containing protein [Paraburkholderia sp. A1RI_3L]|uniref:DUF2306 domain-containing protein n=1 Tax=Paraburkholderia TaxID=1822464 RepID=UPI003B789D15